jgi:hypothetical protein
VRGEALTRAIEYQPNDTLLRTYAALSCLDFDPAASAMHASKMIDDYDGMAPHWATCFNMALIRARTVNIYDESSIFLNLGHWLHPYWPPIKDLLFARDGVGIRSRYIGGPRNMVRGSEESMWKVKAILQARDANNLRAELLLRDREIMVAGLDGKEGLEAEVQALKIEIMDRDMTIIQKDLQLAYVSLKNVLVTEKKRLSVPDNWFYDKNLGEFINAGEADKRKGEDMLTPDAADAVPIKMDDDTKKKLEEYMAGKEAYHTHHGSYEKFRTTQTPGEPTRRPAQV